VPGVHSGNSAYRFGAGEEHLYYGMYAESYFAVTSAKGGWDCLRHYEILAAGCIPTFTDLEKCPALSLVSYPKALLKRATAELTPWHEQNKAAYYRYLDELLEYARTNLTCEALATYVVSKMATSIPVRSVLMLTTDPSGNYFDVNYSREFLALGLRAKFGSNFVDVPKLDVLYDTFQGNVRGHGYSYARLLPDDPRIVRTNVAARIAKREFDLVVFGKVGLHDASLPRLPFWAEVSLAYPKERIAFIYGGDAMQTLSNPSSAAMRHLLAHLPFGTCFVRELQA
jgi:hypothetical protein